MQISIRQADKSDIPAILGLYAQPALDNGIILTNKEALTLFEKIDSYPNYKLYVAFDHDHVLGTFALLIMDNLGHLGKPSAIVEDVAVHPDFQRKGIGREMIQYAMKKSREVGCYKLVISAHKKRKNAHAFYESLGFEKHGYSFVVEIQ